MGHSTITYILNDDLEPTVDWTGDNWQVEDFTADVRQLLEEEQLGGHSSQLIPFLPMTMLVATLAMATVWAGARKGSED